MSTPGGLAAPSPWDRGFDRLAAWSPYLTLAVATAVAMTVSGPRDGAAGTLGRAARAAAWSGVLVGVDPARADRPVGLVRLHYAGMLAFGLVLSLREPVYFVYVISGFFQAHVMRSWWLTTAGVAATSLLVNIQIVAHDPTGESWTTYGIVVAIQTAAITMGMLGGEKLNELSEQRRGALAELEAAQRENEGLHARLLAQAREAGILDERQRMAQEIHDTLAQGLTGIITQLEASRQAGEPADRDRHVGVAAQLARETLAEARRSVDALRPGVLEVTRLAGALAEVAGGWAARTGVAAEVATTGTAHPLDPDVEVALLRIAQEALANVERHAAASRVAVTLSFMDDEVSIDVVDDGVGFVADDPGARHGFGLVGMRERAGHVGGRLSVESTPGEGTAVSATVPVSPGAAAEGTSAVAGSVGATGG